MLLALPGKSDLTLAVVADQLGCSPLLASAGVVVASIYAGRTQSAKIVKRVPMFPAFGALVVGLVVG